MRPYVEKNPLQKRAGGVAQGVGPEFKRQYNSNNNKKYQNHINGLLFLAA
jgi:hypothetical protein